MAIFLPVILFKTKIKIQSASVCASVFVLRQVAVHYWKTVINNAITARDATTHSFFTSAPIPIQEFGYLLTQILFRYLSSALELCFNIIIMIDVFIWGCNKLLSTGKYAEYVLYVPYAHMSQKGTWGKSRSEKQEILWTGKITSSKQIRDCIL